MTATVEQAPLLPAPNNRPSAAASSSTPSRQPSYSASTVASYLPALKISMIKLWPSALSPFDQLTPKAGPNNQERPNPFDGPAPGSGSHTPTLTQSFQHHLLNTHPSTTNSVTLSPDLTPQLLGASAVPTTPGGTLALPTTHLTLHAPDFNMRQPPPSKQHKASPDKSSTPSSSSASSSSTTNSGSGSGSGPTSVAGPSKGQIHVKLIQARGLNVRSISARPYVVVQFEQNEFVSREPTDEMDKEVKGTPTNLSRNGSSSALSALSAIGSKATLDSSKLAKSVGSSLSSSSGNSSLATPNNLFGRLSAHNPVWKHEVSLCAS
jgi:serine/threonine protein kinase SCH9